MEPIASVLEPVTLAVLAGGAGTRMGRPKAWLELHGRPILDHLSDQFDWPGPSLLVTAPGYEHPPGRARFEAEVTDPVAGQGPLRGILTALGHCRTDELVVATVDMPSIGPTHLAWLVSTFRSRPDLLGVLPVRRDTADGGGRGDRTEPFPCALRRRAEAVLADRAAAGEWSVRSLLTVPGFAGVPVPDDWNAAVWTNLNHPADLACFATSRPAESEGREATASGGHAGCG